MRAWMLSSAAALFLLTTVGESADALRHGTRSDYGSLTVDLEANAGNILTSQAELELRRAGGPRREPLEELLSSKAALRTLAWSGSVKGGCQSGVLRWADYVEPARRRVELVREEYKEKATWDLEFIEREAYLESLGRIGGHELYERTISVNLAIRESGLGLFYPEEAAERAIQSNMDDLIPAIKAKMPDWSRGNRTRMQLLLEIRAARLAENPGVRLVELVRSGASNEATALQARARALPEPERDDLAQLAAGYAIAELRRLNPPDVLEGLKQVLALYTPPVPTPTPADRPGPPGADRWSCLICRSAVGWAVAELIGDLGDRQSERQALGGRCLWDQVHEVEVELVKRGKLKPEAMVSVEPAAR